MDEFLWRDGVLYSQSQFVSVKVVDGKIMIPSGDELATLIYKKHDGMYGGREFKDGKLIHGMVLGVDCIARFYDQGHAKNYKGNLNERLQKVS